jgi:hypothetical protein
MKKVLLILICLICSNHFVFSQNTNDIKQRPLVQVIKNPIGSEYYICFMKNYQDLVAPPNPIQLKLFITALNDANVKIEIPSLKYLLEIFIPKNTTQQVLIPKEAQTVKNDVVLQHAAIHVISDNPIFLYGLNTRNQTSDTYLAFPISTLGTRYRIMSFSTADLRLRELAKPEMAISSCFDSTIVKIIPTVELDNNVKIGDTLIVKMNRGDVYQAAPPFKKNKVDSSSTNKWDLTGTIVISNKHIAVFGGHECAFVPLTMPDNTCNHLVEQLPPTASWGKHFFCGKLAKRTTYQFRILADKDSTTIFLNAKTKITLNGGKYYDGRTDQDVVISADKPILVAQYSEGFRNGDNIGDPMMLLLPPTNQFLSDYSFSTPKDGSWNHFINVVVPTASIRNLTVDGKVPQFMDAAFSQVPTYFSPQPLAGHSQNTSIDQFKLVYRQLGLSLYSIATIQIPYGPHHILCTKPFGMYSYGFGFGDDSYDAYGTMGGQTFQEYDYAPDKEPPYIKSSTENNSIVLVVHEDRENDSGLGAIEIKESINIDFEPFTVPLGIAQLKLTAFATSPKKAGRAVIVVRDQVGNENSYTICYIYNADADRYVYEFNETKFMTCQVSDWYAGVFGHIAQTYHYINFNAAGNIKSSNGGTFGNTISNNGIAGGFVSYKFKPMWSVTGKLFFDNINASMLAPDPELSQIYNPKTGGVDLVQEMDRLKINTLFMNLSLSAEWFFDRRLYLTGGINLSTKLYDKATQSREIADPGFKYDATKIYEGPSGMISPLGANLFGGVGFASTLPVYNEYVSVFIELLYNYGLNNYISNGLYYYGNPVKGSWYFNQLALNFGVKYNF